MTYRTMFNPGDSPVVIDASSGATLGGGEWGPVNTLAEGVDDALAAGRLVVIDEPDLDADNLAPEARSAIERTAELRERADVLDDLTKPELVEIAEARDVLEEGEEVPLRAELEEELVTSDVPLTADPPCPTCGAVGDDPCHTASGNETNDHAGRVRTSTE